MGDQMTDFHVVQVVVCVDAAGILWSEVEEGPKEGGIYTIRAVGTDGVTVGVLLEEIHNPHGVVWPDGTVRETGFFSHRFRPAKTTSIEVFEAMLAPVPPVTEPA